MSFRIKTLGIFFFVHLLLVCLAVSLSPAQVITPELQTTLQVLAPQDEVPVIIRLSEKADLTLITEKSKRLRRPRVVRALKEKAKLTQYPLKQFIEGVAGPNRMRELWIINGMALSLRANAIRQLEGWPGIERITLDEKISAPAIASTPPAEPEWNLDAIRAPELWNLGHMGRGVVIATMDSGIDIHHPDLCQKWRGGSNSWFDPYGQHPDVPYDDYGHGTKVLGAIVGGAYGGTHIGVAPYAQWISVKIFLDGERPTASESRIHEGFQWLLDPDGDPETDDAPDVVNNSWSMGNTNECDLEFHEDIRALKHAGIAVVFAAGNLDPAQPNTSVSPANNPKGFAVGGVDVVDGALAVVYDSRRGPSPCDDDGSVYPEVVAPGDNIKTTDRTSGGLYPDSYSFQGGTSIAASHVSGAMALLIGAFPDVTVPELQTALKESAFDLGDPGPDNDYGYGIIDVMAAYEILLESHSEYVPDLVSIPYVRYNAFANTLFVEAKSVPPEGTIIREEPIILNASAESSCIILDSGDMVHDAERDSYKRKFNNIESQPDSVLVTSSGGGASTFYLDKVSITAAVYQADASALIVNAATDRTGGTEILTASVISGGMVIRTKPMKYVAEGDFYKKRFSFISSQPDSVLVTSSGGGASIYHLDKVTITLAAYQADTNTLDVRATTNITGGTEILTASVISGGMVIRTKSMKYVAEGDFYKKRFGSIALQPDSVLVTSSGGGAAIVHLDHVNITEAFYEADTKTVTVKATTTITEGQKL